MSFLPPDHMMILKCDLLNQESLLPPVQPAATHMHYGVPEQRPEGRGLHQHLETTCSHDSLATAMPEVDGRPPEVDGKNSFFTH